MAGEKTIRSRVIVKDQGDGTLKIIESIPGDVSTQKANTRLGQVQKATGDKTLELILR